MKNITGVYNHKVEAQNNLNEVIAEFYSWNDPSGYIEIINNFLNDFIIQKDFKNINDKHIAETVFGATSIIKLMAKLKEAADRNERFNPELYEAKKEVAIA